MKALSIREPYVSQIVNGSKTAEYRSWPTKHRGDLLICGSKTVDGPFAGMAACIVRIVDCIRAEDGGYAWMIEDVRPLAPFPVTGRLSFFEVEVPTKRQDRI